MFVIIVFSWIRHFCLVLIMVIIQDNLHISVIFFVIQLLLDKKILDLRQHCGGIVVVIVFLAHFSIVTFLELCLIIYLICIVFKYIMYIYIYIYIYVFFVVWCICVLVFCVCMLYVYIAVLYLCIVFMYVVVL